MLWRIANALFGCLGAAAAGQFPTFQVQYRQQLAGRLEQVRADLSNLFNEARDKGLAPEEFLERASRESGSYTRILLEDAEQALADHQRLEAAYEALLLSDSLSRPFLFLQHLDPQIARSVAAHFQPALPLTLEGLVYAGLGLLIGVAFAALLEYAGRSLFRSLRQLKRKDQDGGQQRPFPRRG